MLQCMMPAQMMKICRLNETGKTLLETVMEKLGLSARAYDRILKISRTIVVLACTEDIQIGTYLVEAIQYRGLDREGRLG